jgi:hypothetical protein
MTLHEREIRSKQLLNKFGMESAPEISGSAEKTLWPSHPLFDAKPKNARQVLCREEPP